LTFFDTFVFLSGGQENNFSWALENLRELFFRSYVVLEVIVSDINLALINVITNVFPKASNLLRQFHIKINVKTNLKYI